MFGTASGAHGGRTSALPLGLARVRGESMLPTLRPGDLVLVRYAAPVRPAALVLARFADGTLAVKRAEGRRTSRTGGDAWWLLSDNPDQGIDSRHRGAVPEEDVRGVVLVRIWPRPAGFRAPR